MHVRPSIIKGFTLPPDAVVVPLLIAADRARTLKAFFRGRAISAPRRGRKHYLDNIEAIWDLQTLLVSDAETNGVPIVVNEAEGGSMMTRMYSLISAAVLKASPL